MSQMTPESKKVREKKREGLSRYPIKDVQWHEEGLRDAASSDMTREEGIAVAWHSTALAYLQCGAFHQLPGPAAERVVDGKVEVAVIEDYLLPATDSHGLTYFQHVYKEEVAPS